MGKEIVVDMEANGLLDTVTRLWCLSYRYVDSPNDVYTLTNYDDMIEWFKDCEKKGYTLIGHNIIPYDLKAVKKVLGVETSCKVIDTLPLSWYLNHDRQLHGLDSYGSEFGVKKPLIEDWSDQPIETYIHRCEEDTLIQHHLWVQLKKKLQELYNES